MNDPLFLVLACGIPAILALAVILGWLAYDGMVRIDIKDAKSIRESGLESGAIKAEDLELPWIRQLVASPFGYGIAVRALRGSRPRLAVFHHGVTMNWTGMLRYMEIFRQDGWTVVALDSRGHGESRGIGARRSALRPSYGCFEKQDLKAVADWALGEFPHGEGFVVVGESMGAAVALQYAPLDPRLDAVIADCPFSSAVAEMDHQLKCSHAPFFLRGLVIKVADLLCRRLDGFSLFDADPAKAILATSLPILFVHGLEDDYVPWSMSVVMSESRKRRLPDAVTELRLVPDARHAKSIVVDPDSYAEALRAFLSGILPVGPEKV